MEVLICFIIDKPSNMFSFHQRNNYQSRNDTNNYITPPTHTLTPPPHTHTEYEQEMQHAQINPWCPEEETLERRQNPIGKGRHTSRIESSLWCP